MQLKKCFPVRFFSVNSFWSHYWILFISTTSITTLYRGWWRDRLLPKNFIDVSASTVILGHSCQSFPALVNEVIPMVSTEKFKFCPFTSGVLFSAVLKDDGSRLERAWVNFSCHWYHLCAMYSMKRRQSTAWRIKIPRLHIFAFLWFTKYWMTNTNG